MAKCASVVKQRLSVADTFSYGLYNWTYNDSLFAFPEILNISSDIDTWDDQQLDGLPSGYTITHIAVTAVFVGIMSVVIVLGNALVCVAITRDRNLKSTQNWFIACLAVADLLIGLIIIPFSLANELMGYWYFGTVWCELWKAIDVLLCTASINSLCLISLDRYWSITKALHYSRQRTPKRAAIMIALVWILSAGVCLPPLIGWRQEKSCSKEGYPLCVLSDDIGYVLYSSMGSFFVPMIIMVFVYIRVYLAARSRARRNIKSSEPTSQNGRNHPQLTTTSFTLSKKTDMITEVERSSMLSDGDESAFTQYNVQNEKFERKAVSDQMKRSNIQEESSNTNKADDSSTEIRQQGESNLDLPASNSRSAIDVEEQYSSDTSQAHGKPNASLKTCNDHNLMAIESDSAAQTDTPLVPYRSKNLSEDTNQIASSTDAEDKGASDRGIRMFNLKNLLSKKTNLNSVDRKKKELNFKTYNQRDNERIKRKIAKARERRATLVVGIVMAAFILCWLPFFTLYLVAAICQAGYNTECIEPFAFSFFFWLGYCNSVFNPFIYTIFNREFRNAFKKIIFGKSSSRR